MIPSCRWQHTHARAKACFALCTFCIIWTICSSFNALMRNNEAQHSFRVRRNRWRWDNTQNVYSFERILLFALHCSALNSQRENSNCFKYQEKLKFLFQGIIQLESGTLAHIHISWITYRVQFHWLTICPRIQGTALCRNWIQSPNSCKMKS